MKRISPLVYILSLLLLLYSCKDDKKKQDENTPVNSSIITATVSGITAVTAISGGTIHNEEGNNIIVRGICWDVKSNPDVNSFKTVDSAGVGSFTAYMINLQPNTFYYVRAYAITASGSVLYGNVHKFSTLFLSDNSMLYTDMRDGEVYERVEIGSQVWMGSNLRFLPQVHAPTEGSIIDPYYYVFGYAGADVAAAKSTENYAKYGVLYNWAAAQDACPDGWRLPTKEDWDQLEYTVSAFQTTSIGSKLAGFIDLWNVGQLTQNSAFGMSNFNAEPGSVRESSGVFRNDLGGVGFWWNATEGDNNSAWYRFIGSYNEGTMGGSGGNKADGMSVRCVTNTISCCGQSFIDSRDDREYASITLGGQQWMAENLKYLPSVSSPSLGAVDEAHYYVFGYTGETVSEAKSHVNIETYGVLYNWEAAQDACPQGWFLPTKEDWDELEIFVASMVIMNEGSSLAGNENLWTPGTLTDDPSFGESEIDILPGSVRVADGTFRNDLGSYGFIWNATETDQNNAWFRFISSYSTSVMGGGGGNKADGMSVRCIEE